MRCRTMGEYHQALYERTQRLDRLYLEWDAMRTRMLEKGKTSPKSEAMGVHIRLTQRARLAYDRAVAEPMPEPPAEGQQ